MTPLPAESVVLAAGLRLAVFAGFVSKRSSFFSNIYYTEKAEESQWKWDAGNKTAPCTFLKM